ncbi:MAG: OmpA family protein, partial [Syntrophomonadaceae bacterium]
MGKLDDTFELLEEYVPKAPKRQRPKVPVWLLLLLLLVGGAAGAYSQYGKYLPSDDTVPVVQNPVQPPPQVTEPTPGPPPPPPTKEVPTPVNIVVNYDSSSYAIRADELPQLDELAALIRDNPGTLKMSAYTDDEGSDELGQRLSEQRAATMVQYFESKGVQHNIKFDVKAYGERYPIADNSTPEGRAQNRRVEIYFVPDAWSAQ